MSWSRNRWAAAVRKNPYLLANVPDELKDREMCLISVRHDGAMLQFVPDRLLDRRICVAAMHSLGLVKSYYVCAMDIEEMRRVAIGIPEIHFLPDLDDETEGLKQ